MIRLLALFLALLAASAWAIDPPKPPAPPAARAEPAPSRPAADAPPAAQAEPAPEASVPEEEEVLPPLPAGAATTGPAPQRFTPSEKVRADFPVSFPIDI